ncbi:hypothetical protein [Domibacillus enclensis]|uniref:Uncharacterized protein n=1 Tax=Domibacillus enclensis TaxID=1017273 RepID=A0A1N6WL11_9BACI|nr:hypothetical protein [Domibacillus enclensis]OXS77969.1 hypothetical protein B1B05_10205 [Domibacillus enclensis]SIQ90769.1 hypothetical protein SAMN05443094_104203 [Domibacillus enclensis]
MKIIITLQDENQFPLEFEYNAAELAAQANAPGVTVVMLGSMVISKNAIKHIVSAEPLTQQPNTQIQLADGKSITDYVANYNATDIAKQFNDPRTSLVTIGDTLVSKNAFKLVLQLPATETAAE